MGVRKNKFIQMNIRKTCYKQSWAFKKNILKRKRKFRNQKSLSSKRKRKFRNQNFLGLKRKHKFRNQKF